MIRSRHVATFLISILAAVLYSIAAVRLYVALSEGARPAVGPADPADSSVPGRHVTLAMVMIAALLHAGVAWNQTGLPDVLQLPFFTALSVVALGIVALQLLICLRQPAEFLGLAAYPLAAVTLLASQVSHQGGAVQGRAVEAHVALSIIAYALLSLTAAQAILVAVQRHLLQERRPGGLLRALPPLETGEALLFALMSAGFAFLTLSLGSGFFYLEDMFAQHLVHKTVLSCVAWLIFAVLLFGRWRFGWRGSRSVHWTLGGFGTLLLGYFGSKLVLELVLHGG